MQPSNVCVSNYWQLVFVVGNNYVWRVYIVQQNKNVVLRQMIIHFDFLFTI